MVSLISQDLCSSINSTRVTDTNQKEREERMTSKVEKERAKLVQERCQEILTDLLRDDDNKYCVDCDAKGELIQARFDSSYS